MGNFSCISWLTLREVKVKVKNGSRCEVESVYFGSRKERKERKDDSRVEVERGRRRVGVFG